MHIFLDFFFFYKISNLFSTILTFYVFFQLFLRRLLLLLIVFFKGEFGFAFAFVALLVPYFNYSISFMIFFYTKAVMNLIPQLPLICLLALIAVVRAIEDCAPTAETLPSATHFD